jgi:hypothetical protein
MKAIEAGLLTLGSSYSPTPSQRLTRSWLTPVGSGPRSQWRTREGFAPSSQQLHLYSNDCEFSYSAVMWNQRCQAH